MRYWAHRAGLTGPADVSGVVDAAADVGGVLTLRIPRSADDKPVYVAVPPGVLVRRRGGGPGTLRPGQRVSVWQAGEPPTLPPPPGGWGFREAVALLVTIEADPPHPAGDGPPDLGPSMSHPRKGPTEPLAARLDRLRHLRTGKPLVEGVNRV
jgi:hypothetical protein